MKQLGILVKRNSKLFFKDKGLFFTSLITPMILLLLYVTFLGNVYRESFQSALPGGAELSEKLLNGLVGGQLISSLLAVSCVTVAFCSNMLMVQDKVTGARLDLTLSPVGGPILAGSYFIASFFSTMIVCLTATGLSIGYLALTGFYLSVVDVLCILLDVLLLVLFGTALSSILHHFLSTQGQISAVGTIVSSCYGFLCGAYMPIASFSPVLQKILAFLPGTYGTSLLRNHCLRGVLSEMDSLGIPAEAIDSVKNAVDCNISFFDHTVTLPAMYTVLVGTVLLLIAAYILLSFFSDRKLRKGR